MEQRSSSENVLEANGSESASAVPTEDVRTCGELALSESTVRYSEPA